MCLALLTGTRASCATCGCGALPKDALAPTFSLHSCFKFDRRWPKLRPGGMLAGDDFADMHDTFYRLPTAKLWKWGVKSAVASFAKEVCCRQTHRPGKKPDPEHVVYRSDHHFFSHLLIISIRPLRMTRFPAPSGMTSRKIDV